MNITFKYSTYNSLFRSIERKSKIEKIYGAANFKKKEISRF